MFLTNTIEHFYSRSSMENVYWIKTFPWVFQAWKTTTNIADICRLSMTVRTLITVTEWAIIIDSKACSFCTLLIVSIYTVICFVCFNWCFSTGVRGLQKLRCEKSYRVISGWQMGGLGTVWLIAENYNRQIYLWTTSQGTLQVKRVCQSFSVCFCLHALLLPICS